MAIIHHHVINCMLAEVSSRIQCTWAY